MSSIDIEKERMKEWAKINKGDYFPRIDTEAESYFEDCKTNMEITELQFSDMKQLQALLESGKIAVKDKKIDLICAVAAFKRKQSKVDLAGRGNTREDKELPDFIYQF